MIFVTVGTQLPFARLIDAMDAIAATHDEPVVAQTGVARAPSTAWPNLDVHPTLTPEAFTRFATEARLIVGHAGIGTVLSAIRFRKPLILLPRQARLGEHRNEHQLATARQLEGRTGLRIAWEASELAPLVVDTRDLEPMGGDAPTNAQDTVQGESRGDFLSRLAQIIGA